MSERGGPCMSPHRGAKNVRRASPPPRALRGYGDARAVVNIGAWRGGPGARRAAALAPRLAGVSLLTISGRRRNPHPRFRRQPDRRVTAWRRARPFRCGSRRGSPQEGLAAEIVNGGVSGDTSADGLARLDWAMADHPGVVLLELGANDALRGIDPKLTYANLDRILARLKASGVKVLLLGMLAPPNWGRDYRQEFDAIYPRLADKYHVPLYPFILDGVALDPTLMQADGLHPNARGRRAHRRELAPYVAAAAAATRGPRDECIGQPLPCRPCAHPGEGWAAVAKACADQLGRCRRAPILASSMPPTRSRGDLGSILTFLRERTRIADWVGTVGLGVCAAGQGVLRRAGAGGAGGGAAAAELPPVRAGRGGREAARRRLRRLVRAACGRCSASSMAIRRDASYHRANRRAGARGAALPGRRACRRRRRRRCRSPGRVVEGGLSGVLLAPDVRVITGLTQGCSPIGPVRRVTEARDNIVMAIDGRPALEVFKEDIGELLSRDLKRVAGLIFAGFPVAGSDTGDYLVRNLVAIDVPRQWLAVAQAVAPGDPVLFCRRDPASAATDLTRCWSR